MAELQDNINQAISDFDSIKKAIEDCGVDVPYGTDTSEYGALIEESNENARLAGVKQGIEDGKKAEYDAFWDSFQIDGNRDNYDYAFKSWKADILKPKYNLNFRNITGAFQNIEDEIDLDKHFKDLGVEILFHNNGVTLSAVFADAKITKSIPIYSNGNLYACFNRCTNLETIPLIHISAHNAITFTNTFQQCTSLKNLTFEGVIDSNGLNLQWSPLTHESLLNIINALADKSQDTSGKDWLVTLGTNNIAKLTDEDKNLIKNKGWRIA